MKKLILPDWANCTGKGRIEIDADAMYPDMLPAIGAPEIPSDLWLEAAYQCAKMEVQRAIGGTETAPEPGGALVITINSKPDKLWRQKGDGSKGAPREVAAFVRECWQRYNGGVI